MYDHAQYTLIKLIRKITDMTFEKIVVSYSAFYGKYVEGNRQTDAERYSLKARNEVQEPR